jgi:hypothetical protein
MSNQNGDIDAFNGGNSKSPKDVRQVQPEARTTRRFGDRPQGSGRAFRQFAGHWAYSEILSFSSR